LDVQMHNQFLCQNIKSRIIHKNYFAYIQSKNTYFADIFRNK